MENYITWSPAFSCALGNFFFGFTLSSYWLSRVYFFHLIGRYDNLVLVLRYSSKSALWYRYPSRRVFCFNFYKVFLSVVFSQIILMSSLCFPLCLFSLSLGFRLLPKKFSKITCKGNSSQRQHRETSSWAGLHVGCTESFLRDWRRSSHGLNVFHLLASLTMIPRWRDIEVGVTGRSDNICEQTVWYEHSGCELLFKG